jgi:uncharacterized protein YbbC (DUF1343 family)/CubicO group peptidase (beta-lactamase class C family)
MSHISRTMVAAFLVELVVVTSTLAATLANRTVRLRNADLAPIGDVVRSEIEAARIPGAVIEIGQGDNVVYRRAFGYRELQPRRSPMTPDTIFDLASLTKPVATTIAIMQLRESGELDLDAPVARYWPRFASNGKEQITLRELMTHYSGLGPDLDLKQEWTGYNAAMRMIEAQRPIYPPGARYQYSDINFEALGEVVRRISGLSLDVYCQTHIFGPLGMADTGFRPPITRRDRTAPTAYVNGKLRWGEVHDPTAARMGGVAGHAGLFSTADDLAIFARMLLSGGRFRGVPILTSRSIEEMTIPETPAGAVRLRGLGWDLAAPFSSDRDQLLPVGSYGHSGFTGTMLWVDPVSATYVIILTNRTYPNGAGDAGPLRSKILALVSDRLGPLSENRVIAERPALIRFYEMASAKGSGTVRTKLSTGADVLAADGFAELKGKRVGLITNQTGVTQIGVSDIDALSHAPGLTLTAIFGPEHGLNGDAEGTIASGLEPTTGLHFYSLYGDVTRPNDSMLAGINALVFDVQDSGARFYTYPTTMAYAMEEAARRGIDFYVLDRPDPISADVVEGPVMDADLKSFTGFFPLPTRHGMTIGELAEMFNREDRLGAHIHVIRMRGYNRNDWYDQTGLRWEPPSPNLKTLTETTLYPGVGMVEGANLSVGRGTGTPFELVGAPWIASSQLSVYLEGRRIPGVRFEPVDFIPSTDRYANRLCHGVRIVLEDRSALDSPALGVELIAALHRLYPEQFDLQSTLAMLGSHRALEQIKAGDDPKVIGNEWQTSLDKFRLLRAKYLLY